nr:hypothetical protein [Tanacetum cinerariifolium]
MHIQKNVLEAILNTLLMNDKSKDTVKARQDLQRLGIRSGLWLGQTKNEKCLKPQAAYSFTPVNRKKFCQFIKGVKLPDGFGSCFKHKQICSATLMEDDMLKAQIKVVDILCDLELIYPPALFDIMIHLVIHLPLEALEGGPIHPRWILFPNKDMKEEFSDWFGSQIRQRHINNDKDPERHLFAWPNGEMYYGQLQEILEFKYLLFKVVLFRVKWFDTRNQERKVKRLVLRNNMTQIDTRAESFKDDQYILVTKVKQVFYLKDKAKPYWRVVEHVNHKKFFDGGVIVVEDDPDIIHFDSSSDLLLSTSLNDLDNATLHIYGQSTEVDVPSYIIIDVVDEDDDITDDEDTLPHDLAESNNKDLINVDDDGVDKISADVARSHGGDGGGEDHPLHTMYPAVAWVALLTKTKANGSQIWAAGQRAG